MCIGYRSASLILNEELFRILVAASVQMKFIIADRAELNHEEKNFHTINSRCFQSAPFFATILCKEVILWSFHLAMKIF